MPAFRRITSPWYFTPFPLYGSGLRKLRISAATCPTSSLLIPAITTVVGLGAVIDTPAGAWYSIWCENPSDSSAPYGLISAL